MFASAIRAARQGFLGGSPLVITEGAELCTSAAAFVLVRFNHVASGIVNADHSPDVIDCDDLRTRLRC
jgi:hypothetical protein